MSILFLIIFHHETITLLGVKVSHAWKIFVIFALMIIWLKNDRLSQLNGKIKLSILFLYCIWPLVNYFITFDFYSIEIFAIRLLFTLFLVNVLNQNIKIEDSYKLLKILSVFIVLSFIPYKIGILESLGKSVDLINYSELSGKTLVGVFQNPHSASLILAMAGYLFVVFSLYEKTKFKKYFYIMMFVTTVIMSLFVGVRSGLMFLFLSTCYYVMFSKNKIKSTYIIMVIVASSVLYSLYSYSYYDNYLKKLLGMRKYTDNYSLNIASSGRIDIWSNSIDIFYGYNIVEKIFGIGFVDFSRFMERKLGLAIFAHNSLLNELLIFGAVGFLIAVVFYCSLYTYAKNLKNIDVNGYYAINGFVLGMLFFSFFQNFDYVPHLFLFPLLVNCFDKNRRFVTI
jgi:hypothetical protein